MINLSSNRDSNLVPHFRQIAGVCERFGRSRGSVYADVKAGIFPPPIKLPGGGGSCGGPVRWIESELDEMARAYVRGVTDRAALKLLVVELVAKRERIAEAA
ncbi:MAG TPA: hypothetical protein PKA20_05730 [Burkholderiaceae bacterium]|nr:hypothetical protein [Burkholderiaceae bacterium]